MINWTELVRRNKKAVMDFATHNLSATDFQRVFSGNPNPAREAVRNYGHLYTRRLARKALRRRGVSV